MRKKIEFLFIFMFFFVSIDCFSQSQGEKLFKENNPKDAVQVLENEILNNQISANTYNFLGLGYYQLGEYEKSADAFERGIKAQPSNTKILSFNQGNSYFALKNFEKAAECFGNSYKQDNQFYDALLNRANSYLMYNKLVLAKNDYEEFLEKSPETEQKDKIEKLIQMIIDEIERQKEEQRLLEEQNKAKWEYVDTSITENFGENGVVWEKINGDIDEMQNVQNSTNWQKIDDTKLGGIQITENKKNWEKIMTENAKAEELNDFNAEKSGIIQKNTENDAKKENWQEINKEIANDIPQNEIIKTEKNSDDLWENIFAEDNSELERLNIQAQKEFEQWEKQQELIKKRKQQEELLRKKALEDEEKQKRQEFLREMMDAENERRQKLLENVQNSLQGNDSKNVSSEADDIIEYEREGELD